MTSLKASVKGKEDDDDDDFHLLNTSVHKFNSVSMFPNASGRRCRGAFFFLFLLLIFYFDLFKKKGFFFFF